MDDGLIQLLVIGVFVVISVMEGISRKKRRQSQALQSPDETEVEFLASLTEDEQEEPGTPDGVVPELWAEVAELARGGTLPAPELELGLEPEPEPEFEPEPELEPEPEPALLVGTDSRDVALRVAETASFGRMHSSGLADLEKDKHFSLASGGRSAIVRFFGDRAGRMDELRRAVILSEILGPPVSLREPREL